MKPAWGPLALRLGAVALLAWLAYLTVATSIARLSQSVNPQLALEWRPNDARALASAASQGFRSGTPPPNVLAASEELARRAVAREAILPSAYAVLAQVARFRGQPGRSARLLAYGDRLSRRNLATQILFAEIGGRTGDLEGMLDHLHTVFQVSPEGRVRAVPPIAAATADPRSIVPIAQLLRRDTDWRLPLINSIIARSPSLDNVVKLIGEVERQSGQLPDEQRRLLIDRLIRRKRFELAEPIFRSGRGRDGNPAVLRLDFDGSARGATYGWHLVQTDATEAAIVPRAGKGGALHFGLFGERRVEFARYLLFLPPGAYSLEASVEVSDRSGGARLGYAITCATDSRRLLDGEAEERDQVKLARRFSVPAAGCGAQWLSLSPSHSGAGPRIEGQVSDVTIRRAG